MAKAEQRLALEGGHKEATELKAGGRYHNKAGEYAMHKFAYYICSKCQAPYFGGQVPLACCSCCACIAAVGFRF